MNTELETELYYPLALDDYGDLKTTNSYEQQVRQAIMSALNTQQGERVYRDRYGLAPTLFTTDRNLSHIRAVKAALEFMVQEYPDVPYEVTGYILDGVSRVQVAYVVNNKLDTQTVSITP